MELIMNKLIEVILKKGFSLEIGYNTEKDRFEYSLDGFYKSGKITLYENDHGTLNANSRYGQVDIIENFYNLVALNHQWWCDSKDRFDGWSVPDSTWLPFLIEEGFIEAKSNNVITYISKKY